MFSFARAVERHVLSSDYDVVVGLGKTWTHDVIRLGGGCHQTFLDQTPRRSRLRVEWLRNRCALMLEARGLARGAYTRVMTNSMMVKRDVMSRYNIPEKVITIVPNGVDVDRFHPRHKTDGGAMLRQQLGFDTSHIVLVFVGTGYQRKGLDRLMQVFPILRQQCPASRLLVVGHDSNLLRWQRQAESMGIASYIRFLGARRDPEICYGAGDLYVLPTRYDPFANATLEALASGLPVITTVHNGGCEVLEHGVHGTLMDNSDNPQTLLQALLPWLDRRRLQETIQVVHEQAAHYGFRREMEASTTVLMEAAATKRKLR
jgi:UDP-glucose:(heptosyl)LPS alpha-1,3-glucosyltransferase